jgi:glycosyltransferase involved in cell wall biosynthesis
MRIAVIGTRGSAGPARDGIDKALHALCPRLAGRGHRIDVFSERNGHAFGPIDGVQVIRLPALRWGRASSHPTVSALLSTCGAYDVVNFVAAEPSGLFSHAARIGPYRTVVSINSGGVPYPQDGGQPDQPVPHPRREGAAARFADVVTVSSRRLERLFRNQYGREPIYIPNGLDSPPPPIDPAAILALGLVPDQYMLLADRLIAPSAAHMAVAAARALDNAMPLAIAETGPADEAYRAELEHAANGAPVIFLGRVAPPLLDALIAHSYLYLLPSQGDEAPPGLMTALAHGRAVVVSDLPDHLDLVGADGFTFTAGEFGDLRRVLTWLLNDRDVVMTIRQRAGINVATRYCWDRVVDAYEHIYQALL